MKLVVIDLGLGNLRSVEQAVNTVCDEAQVSITSRPEDIRAADKIILPGQGAIGSWFAALQTSRQASETQSSAHQQDLLGVLNDVLQTKPVLGICVGMQAMFDYCEEGDQRGLGLFQGEVRHFSHFHQQNDQAMSRNEKMKIPQMGWNQVAQTNAHPIWRGIDNLCYFYFVHSYCANLSDQADESVVMGEADYGHKFIAAVAKDNVFAVQFHPEKSHKNGLQLLKNFTQWDGQS